MVKTLLLLLSSLGVALAFYEGLKLEQGAKADPPFAVLIETEKQPPLCSGFLIDLSTVLTTASCITNQKCEDLLISRSAYTSKIQAKECIFHENYTRKMTIDDIAIIKLKEPFKMLASDNEDLLITIPNKGKVPLKQVMYYGWYTLSKSYELGELEICNPVKCEEILGPAKQYFSKDRHLCTKAMFDSSKTTCKSLFGTPLIESTDNAMQLIGLMSWGTIPCVPGEKNLAIYTRVSEYKEWIDKKSK
ncbi:hypothetical protein ACFFRR_004488 [Megaselia abdita]